MNGHFDTNDVQASSITLLISPSVLKDKDSATFRCEVGYFDKYNAFTNSQQEIILSKSGKYISSVIIVMLYHTHTKLSA